MNNNQTKLHFREKPFFVWGIGIFMLIVGGVMLFNNREQWIASTIVMVVAVLVFLAGTVVEVSADKVERVLTISRRSILRKSNEEILFEDIDSIQLGTSYDDEDGTTTYRVEVRLKDGSVVPLRSVYSSGRKKKEEQAQTLREFIGLSQSSEAR